MRHRLPLTSRVLRVLALLVLLGALAGCGSALQSARAQDPDPPPGCPQTVMATLGSVLQRVYREGVSSERTASAEHLIEHSVPLRKAIEANSAAAARVAAHELLKTGHLTNLDLLVGGRHLISVGGAALTPLHGTISGLAGKTIASYTTSVWADRGFASETSGVAEGLVALRAGGKSIGGTLDLPEGPLPAEGSLTRRGITYQYSSFTGRAYPTGSVQIYLLKPLPAVEKLCGSSEVDTEVAALKRVAELIYEGESGPRTLTQIHRVQQYQPLLSAVAAHDVPATKVAVAELLHHHLVRLRVSAAGKLLYDDGGPFVLAPVHAELRSGGRKIGDIVLSIQDDEGYLRLTHRLAGLDVLMYMRGSDGKPRLVKNSLGPGVGPYSSVPASGPYSYRGKSFRVFTVEAIAFPSGPLTIRVLVPLPYT